MPRNRKSFHMLISKLFTSTLWSIHGEGNGTPLQYLPGKSHGWRSLEGCSPWGHWGSDTTERLHIDFSVSEFWVIIPLIIYVCWLCVHAQPCLTLYDPTDCSPPGSSAQGVFPSKNTGVGCHFLLQETFPTQRWNLCLLHLQHWQVDSLPWAKSMSVSQIILHGSSGQSEWVAALLTAYPATIHCILFTKRIPILFIFLNSQVLGLGYVPS